MLVSTRRLTTTTSYSVILFLDQDERKLGSSSPHSQCTLTGVHHILFTSCCYQWIIHSIGSMVSWLLCSSGHHPKPSLNRRHQCGHHHSLDSCFVRNAFVLGRETDHHSRCLGSGAQLCTLLVNSCPGWSKVRCSRWTRQDSFRRQPVEEAVLLAY